MVKAGTVMLAVGDGLGEARGRGGSGQRRLDLESRAACGGALRQEAGLIGARCGCQLEEAAAGMRRGCMRQGNRREELEAQGVASSSRSVEEESADAGSST